MSYQTVQAHFKTPAALRAALVPYGSITLQAIYKWRESNAIPTERAPVIEAASGGSLRCEQICPAVHWLRDSAGNLTGYRVPVHTRHAS